MRISDWSSDVCASDLSSTPAGPSPPAWRYGRPGTATALCPSKQLRPLLPRSPALGEPDGDERQFVEADEGDGEHELGKDVGRRRHGGDDECDEDGVAPSALQLVAGNDPQIGRAWRRERGG